MFKKFNSNTDIFKKYENTFISSQNTRIMIRFKYNIEGVEEIITKFGHLQKKYTDFNEVICFGLAKK